MKRTLVTSLEKTLDQLASAARGFGLMESWATLDALRYFALRYAAEHVRSSDDNPDVTGGGSVASFLDHLAAKIAPAYTDEVAMRVPADVKQEPVNEDDHHITRDEFFRAVTSNAFIDYDGFGELATATSKTNVRIFPSEVAAKSYQFPRWATHVVWYNR